VIMTTNFDKTANYVKHLINTLVMSLLIPVKIFMCSMTFCYSQKTNQIPRFLLFNDLKITGNLLQKLKVIKERQLEHHCDRDYT
jgi:hypothetical protein